MAEIFGWVAAHGDTTVAPTTRRAAAAGQRAASGSRTCRTGPTPPASTTAAPCTPTELRRLCCDAGVIPIVLDGAGQPLDVGRASPHRPRRDAPRGHRPRPRLRPPRLHPPTVLVRNPPHPRVGIRRGRRHLSNLVMLCSVHHREIHSSGWIVRIAADGLPEFIPPPWIDLEAETTHETRPYLETGHRPTTTTDMTDISPGGNAVQCCPLRLPDVQRQRRPRPRGDAIHMIGLAAIDPPDALRCERLGHRWAITPRRLTR